MSIAGNFEKIRARIESASRARTHSVDRVVELIAVSKGQPAAAIAELYALGQRDFGENYVQELVAKATELSEKGLFEIRWHFIGHLQSNKCKQLAPWVSSVHSLDSESTARELAKRWQAAGHAEALPVFLEVNIDVEPAKSGVKPEEAPAVAQAIAGIPGLELRGLMCVPAASASASASASAGAGAKVAFAKLRELEVRCRPFTRGDLSMGMSGDFEAAIDEGATHVRVGTSLFGARAG
jgi:pyridoxal phosphate enzyme (YggS family)